MFDIGSHFGSARVIRIEDIVPGRKFPSPRTMGSIGPRYESALIKAAEQGAAKICAAFGGQSLSNLQCFDDLVGLNAIYGPELHTLIQIASSNLSTLASIPHTSGFHDDLGFDIQEWLANPSSVPSREHMALSPISFPINTLLSLAHYCDWPFSRLVRCRCSGQVRQLAVILRSIYNGTANIFLGRTRVS
jgi:hypothetical protein